MNAQELAARLDGREYGKEVTRQDEADAREAGLVIVFGASDDLMEFRGAINDEVGAYEGGTAYVDAQGLIPVEYEDLSDEETYDMLSRKQHAIGIFAQWCPDDDLSWRIETNLPHSTFTIFDNGETYCEGLVFALKDAAAPESIERRAIGWLLNGDVGTSSKAILTHMLGIEKEGSFGTPSDPSDFNRCLLLIELFPEWKPRLSEMSQHNRWEPLVSNWAALEAMFIDEVGRNWCKANSAPKTYDFMKKLGL